MYFCLRKFNRSVQYNFSIFEDNTLHFISFITVQDGVFQNIKGQMQLLILRPFLGFD